MLQKLGDPTRAKGPVSKGGKGKGKGKGKGYGRMYNERINEIVDETLEDPAFEDVYDDRGIDSMTNDELINALSP